MQIVLIFLINPVTYPTLAYEHAEVPVLSAHFPIAITPSLCLDQECLVLDILMFLSKLPMRISQISHALLNFNNEDCGLIWTSGRWNLKVNLFC
jgi:hypothetical protein